MALAAQYPLARSLRDKIKIQRRNTDPVPDAYGGSDTGWIDFATSRPANMVPFRPRRRGGDEVEAGRLQATAPFDCWVRFDSLTSQVIENPADFRVIDLRDTRRVFQIGFAQDMDSRRLWILLQLELGVAT